MKSVQALICGILLAIGTVHAADNQPANSSASKQNQQAKSEKETKPLYTWQECVDDNVNEGGFSRQQAYKLCENLNSVRN